MSPPPDTVGDLAGSVKRSWQRFLELYEPLRPELYRYCRYLTRSPWDAEDLVQDTFARAFATLGCLFQEPPNPRAWMFRVASNLWIDQQRRAREVLGAAPEATVEPEARADRDAASTLIARLAPRERVCVVLKDVFELSLEEIAEVLSTTPGAVKAALHRGRGKLVDNDERVVPLAPSPKVVEAFVDAFNARDLDRLTALLLDTSVAEIVGVVTEYGPAAARDPETGSFAGFLSPITSVEQGAGIEPSQLQGYLGQLPRVEVRSYRGEPILLFWYAHTDREAVRTVARLETRDARLARVQNYFFTPDVIADVCGELGVPFRTNGYRYWPTTRLPG